MFMLHKYCMYIAYVKFKSKESMMATQIIKDYHIVLPNEENIDTLNHNNILYYHIILTLS